MQIKQKRGRNKHSLCGAAFASRIRGDGRNGDVAAALSPPTVATVSSISSPSRATRSGMSGSSFVVARLVVRLD